MHSDEHQRSFRNCDCDKNEIAKQCWEADHNFNWNQKKVIEKESRLIPRKIKETIHSLKNPNHINKTSYISLSNSHQHLANADAIANVKSKIIVSRQHFFADKIFLPLQKFKTIKIKPEKNP